MSILDLSIVLPVYNTASYLRRCLDSLAAQAALPKEIIAIDDGSTDESKTILVEYAANRLPMLRELSTKKTMACLPHAIQGFDWPPENGCLLSTLTIS